MKIKVNRPAPNMMRVSDMQDGRLFVSEGDSVWMVISMPRGARWKVCQASGVAAEIGASEMGEIVHGELTVSFMR